MTPEAQRIYTIPRQKPAIRSLRPKLFSMINNYISDGMTKMRGTEALLFSQVGWFNVAENQKAGLAGEVAGLMENQLLNASKEDLLQYLTEKFSVDVPVFDEGNASVDQKETQIDVRHDPRRFVIDHGRPLYVTGTIVELAIPFSGDPQVFHIQPTTFSLSAPRAEIRGNEVVIQVIGTDLSPDQVKLQLKRSLDEVKENLDRLRADALKLNNQIKIEVERLYELRRQKILSDKSLVASLGFPLKRRPDAPATYKAPEVRRRTPVQAPQATTTPFKPEPSLVMIEYENILSLMKNMAVVMERSPSAFVSMAEEDLRMHFLVQLNGQYEGQATGETFNYGGKTDILIRSDGKNIFIGECKYWTGPKGLLQTVDQLLGYTSWRDSKASIILFNRQKNFSQVLESVSKTMPDHPNTKRTLATSSDTAFRYVLSQRDDPNREMIVTVLVFDVPQPQQP